MVGRKLHLSDDLLAGIIEVVLHARMIAGEKVGDGKLESFILAMDGNIILMLGSSKVLPDSLNSIAHLPARFTHV